VINNIERVASLFLVKTTYALFFAIFTIVSGSAFPFLPRHLTLVGTLTIGTPAFFLALAPNDQPVRAGFLGRVLRIAIPGGLLASVSTFIAYTIARQSDLDPDPDRALAMARTTATIVLAACAILILVRVARPFAVWKIALVTIMAVFIALTMIVPFLRDFFEIVMPPSGTVVMMTVVVAITAALLPVVWRVGERAVGWGEQVLQRRREGRVDTSAPAS
ncbi:MAG TPA: hypothetical protein PLV68_05595, partial [Ilumatobacteraceae bacterium]|nr:hypothetical protein [Ilumatobacteraceae bacterium]